MVILDLKQETPAASKDILVDTKAKNDLKTISFAAILAGMNKDKEGASSASDEKVSLEGLLSKQQESDTKSSKESLNNLKSTLLELEGENFSQDVDSDDLGLLNQKLNSSLSEEDLKTVIKGAKSYLKEQILSSEGFKRSEIDKLPKTLKGLTQAAEKVGIDISKITLEEVRLSSKIENSADERPKVLPKEDLQKSFKKEISDGVQKGETGESKGGQKVPSASKTLSDDLSSSTVVKQEKSTQVSQRVSVQENRQYQEEKFLSQEGEKVKSDTSIFQAKTKKSMQVSTEQIVTVKVLQESKSTTEKIKPKKQADETLQTLLQAEDSFTKAERSSKTESLFSSDFSVAAAKVIAPSVTKQDTLQSLESLLNPEASKKEEEGTLSKTESISKVKTESFELKLNEAKQMMKYLSQDVKQAIDNYKSPFTRVKVQLNPQQLGEIDLTVVQRGKNLHVNLSSNNAAINTLALNANELRVQLQNSGINNASLNFSNNSQGGEFANNSGQQQNREQAQSEYNYFESEEENEEIVSSLEIVVPNYA